MPQPDDTVISPLQSALSPSGPISPDELEVYDEHDAEKESSSPEAWAAIETPDEQDDTGEAVEARLAATVSTGVKDTTHQEYLRISNGFNTWSKDGGYIPRNVDVFGETVPENITDLICLWILLAADNVNPDGTPKPWDQKRVTYSYAMRMRAALTYRFGRLATRGNMEWSLAENGQWKGNPSLSLQVSRYMVSLRRRKAQDGEATMSSRAITTSVLRDLFAVNSNAVSGESGPSPVAGPSPGASRLGPRARRMLQAAYIIAFMCLLRFDEVLAIKLEDLRILDEGNAIELTLPHRKMAQYGGVKPFKMHKLPLDEAYLCPVRAIAFWVKAYGATSGYLFPSFASKDRPRLNENSMSSEAFLRLFRRNLLEVRRDPTPYGTHSFRRGGCQYFATELRWPIRRICDWGGWSLNLTHLTIVKYLISWNDDPLEPREDYLNRNRPPAIKCYACGRSCHCS